MAKSNRNSETIGNSFNEQVRLVSCVVCCVVGGVVGGVVGCVVGGVNVDIYSC